MDIRLLYFNKSERKLVEVCSRAEIPEIENGKLKFVFDFWVDLHTKKLFLFLACGMTEHKDLLGQTPSAVYRAGGETTYQIYTGDSNGGGFLRIQDEVLVFSGESASYGPYKKELLCFATEELKEKFGVSDVWFE